MPGLSWHVQTDDDARGHVTSSVGSGCGNPLQLETLLAITSPGVVPALLRDKLLYDTVYRAVSGNHQTSSIAPGRVQNALWSILVQGADLP